MLVELQQTEDGMYLLADRRDTLTANEIADKLNELAEKHENDALGWEVEIESNLAGIGPRIRWEARLTTGTLDVGELRHTVCGGGDSPDEAMSAAWYASEEWLDGEINRRQLRLVSAGSSIQ